MIIKGKLKGFIVGIIVCTLITSYSNAASLVKQINVYYNNIKLYVDGELIIPKDSEGNIIEPFIYNGTTYLPVRAVGQALGKQVDWNSESYSVIIGKTPSSMINEVTVETTDQFLKAIKSYTKIKINTPQLIFSNAINIKATNLTIEAADNIDCQIYVQNRYANVFNFEDSNNITINRIQAGHTPENKGYCTGGVLNFKNCNNIEITKSALFGCGTEGITLEKVDTLNLVDSTITDCTYGIMTINNSKNVKFKQAKLTGNKGFDFINLHNSKTVTIEDSEISSNDNSASSKAATIISNYALFSLDFNSDMLVKNTKIINNNVHYFQKGKGKIFRDLLVLENSPLDNNTFIKSIYEDQQ